MIAPKLKDHFLPDLLPGKPKIPPLAKIPVTQLDFAPPNPIFVGYRYSMASLDFLGENQLLFTFRVPGLIRRGPGGYQDNHERQMRAVVLALPSGKIQANARWKLYDQQRYVWPLNDGHFLLRVRATLFEGNKKLQLKPILHFPGPLLTIGMDPNQEYLLTNSREPAVPPGRTATGSPAAGSGGYRQASGAEPEFVLRLLRRSTGDVVMVSREQSVIHLPINSTGYLQSAQLNGPLWTVRMNYFNGGSANLATIKSACLPTYNFISENEMLATTCKQDGGFRLIGMTTAGQLLWSDTTSGYSVWPLVRRSANGLRLVRETLAVTHPIGAFWALEARDVEAQRVRVFNAATGDVVFETTVDPVLDGGGNVAISPSGRRVAILTHGAIDVYDLPPAPPLPKPPGTASAQ